MKKIRYEDFNTALCGLDESLLSEHAEREEKLVKKKKRTKVLIRITSAAACICVVTVSAFAFFGNDKNLIDRDDPAVSQNGIVTDEHYVGLTHLEVGTAIDNSGSSSIMAPVFSWGQIVEVRLSELLEATYYYPGTTEPYKIARLEVISELHSEGLPSEIYLQCGEAESGLLIGYDTFIMSIRQTGINDYVMINGSSNSIEYFPNMFEVSIGLGYGNVIAFNNNRVEEEYLERGSKINRINPSNFDDIRDHDKNYPVQTSTATLTEVKQNIREYYDTLGDNAKVYRYKTEKDIFCTEETLELLEYLKAEESVFRQSFENGITYTRVIAGFISEEEISIKVSKNGSCEITRSEIAYTKDEIKSFPDIASVIEAREIIPDLPPHLTYTEALKFRKGTIMGYCRKIDGKVCGIVSTLWVYDVAGGFTYDTEYEVYETDGSSRIIEADELREMIEKSAFVITPMKDGIAMNVSI